MSEANRRDGNDVVDFLIAMIEAQARPITPNDFSAAHSVLARQGLALDALFGELAREAAEDITRGHEPMGVALKAQSQCRRTLTYLALPKRPRSPARGRSNFAKSHEQTVENGNRAE